MPEINFADTQKKRNLSRRLKDSLFMILALVFVGLYAAAFAGKLDPLKDNTMLIRLEPVILILIGYYLGRHPSEKCEESLQDEITRQSRIAEAAQFAKEKAQQERDVLEEKVKNVRVILGSMKDSSSDNDLLKTFSRILDS